MGNRKQMETLWQAAKFVGCFACEFKGKGITYRQLLRDCEDGGAVVYWGCWSEKELDEVIE